MPSIVVTDLGACADCCTDTVPLHCCVIGTAPYPNVLHATVTDSNCPDGAYPLGTVYTMTYFCQMTDLYFPSEQRFKWTGLGEGRSGYCYGYTNVTFELVCDSSTNKYVCYLYIGTPPFPTSSTCNVSSTLKFIFGPPAQNCPVVFPVDFIRDPNSAWSGIDCCYSASISPPPHPGVSFRVDL